MAQTDAAGRTTYYVNPYFTSRGGASGPADVMLVIDRSGSMNGDRIADARTAAGELVQLLNLTQSQHRAGLVTFENFASLDHALTQDETSLLAAINAINASGNTDMADGIALAHTELIANDPRPEAQPVMVLLVDGGTAQAAVTAAEDAKADGVRIIVVGIDIEPASASVLQNQIATSPEDYYPAAGSGQLSEIYTAIAGSLAAGTKYYYVGQQQLASRINNKLHYVLSDPSGQAVVFTDDAGQEIGQVLFDPLGRIESETDPVLTASLLRHLDLATGLQYNDGRWYDPGTGLHLQPIPQGAPRSFPQATTPYAVKPLGQTDGRLLDHGTSFPSVLAGEVLSEGTGLGVEFVDEKVVKKVVGREFLKTILKAKFAQEFAPGFIAGGIFAIPNAYDTLTNPRLTGPEKLVQVGVEALNVSSSGLVGAGIVTRFFSESVIVIRGFTINPLAVGVSILVGIGGNLAFENYVKPIVSNAAVRIPNFGDPFRVIRRPKPRRYE